MFKRPTKMSNDELWSFIMTGEFIPDNTYNKVHETIDFYNTHPGFYEFQKRVEADIKRHRKQQKINNLFRFLGEFIGVLVVFMFYTTAFYFIAKIFYPISFLKAFLITFLLYCVAKIVTMPLIRKIDNG